MSIFEEARGRADKGEGAVVGVVAELGNRQQRLCVEFVQCCRADGIEVFEAQAQSHGRSIPFMPVLQMMRAYFGHRRARAGSACPGEDRRSGAAAGPGFADDLPLLFDFLGVPDPDRPAPAMSAQAWQRAWAGSSAAS